MEEYIKYPQDLEGGSEMSRRSGRSADAQKILFYDIETSPNLGYIWGKYEQNVLSFTKEWYILCFAYRWGHESKTHVVSLVDFPEFQEDPTNDIQVVKKLHELFEEADILVAHNGDRFDQRKVNSRFIFHGLKPPAPYRSVDTLKISRKHFDHTSHRLNDLGEFLGVGKKVPTGGFELWLGCIKGDLRAWRKMARYNKRDVILLYKVYQAMLPWIHNHPAILPDELDTCPKCGSTNIHKRGFYRTKTMRYQRYQCQDCGGWVRSRKSDSLAIKPSIVNV